ncbi:hypothetical protein MBLNU459_g8482t1 [Dothideomycetes sp. NU459]
MLQARSLWSSSPPEPRSRNANYPTLLFSWWCTGFAVAIILARLWGRKIRTGKLFREDKIMALSLLPLLIRMGLVHVILLFGTNNVITDGLTERQIWHRSIGSRLVLASRIFYALFIWIAKFTVSEFLTRLPIWRRSYELGLRFIRVFLVVTFFAVVIATIGGCQPFDDYWQVVPPAPMAECRQGFAQLITMGVSDILTDVLLIAFPIPIILRSAMSIKRKISLVALFSLSLILIGITGTRVPQVIIHLGRQQYRTVWASCEILASTAVSNAVIIGSFVRDKGVKRNKYRRGSTLDSLERASTRRPTITAIPRDSDEDLFRAIGCRIPQDLQDPKSPIARPAPTALPAFSSPFADMHSPRALANTHSHDIKDSIPPLDLSPDGTGSPHDSADTLPKPPLFSEPPPSAHRTVSFFDVGGLLVDGPVPPSPPPMRATVSQDFALASPTSQRSLRNPFHGVGGFVSPASSRITASFGRRRSSQSQQLDDRGLRGPASSNTGLNHGTAEPRSQSPVGFPMLERDESGISLQDVGGLLR